MKEGFRDNEVIRLTKNGLWYADDQEITHAPTRVLFSKSLQKIDGHYTLVIGREKKRVLVEDTPYFVKRIDGNTQNGYELTLNTDEKEGLNPRTISYRPGRLVCTLQNGERAKFLPVPYHEILRDLEEDRDGYFIQILGNRIKLLEKKGPS